MTQFQRGDRFKVTQEGSPFYGCVGEVVEDMDKGPFSVVSEVTCDGKQYPCSYRPGEITPIGVQMPAPVEQAGGQ